MEIPRTTLTQIVLQSLQGEISEGRYKVGTRLPAEPQLAKQFGVSRTIIREVIAALKATGNLESRHGVGIYVLSPRKEEQSSTLFDTDYINLSDILEVMELRMAVEIEAAGLAAVRRTTAQLMKLLEVLRAMENAIKAGHPSDIKDFEFHKAIAVSTNNERYVEFFNFFQGKVIPRSRLYEDEMDQAKNSSYLQQILKEHYNIYAAITASNEAEARKSMRCHLISSQNFYKTLFMQISESK